jgi:CheY-like chemotaxis protein/two-component sensor histidine kinase
MLEMDRMIAVGTLAAGVGHEINNPLAYVIANMSFLGQELPELTAQLRLLRREEPAGAGQKELLRTLDRLQESIQALSEAREGAERVRKVVKDLKNFSRADEHQPQAVDVHPAVDFAARVAWNELRHRARLVKDYGRTPLVKGNASRLGQVFLNLLVNAAHAIPEGHSEANEIRVVTGADALGRATIEVRDTGGGMTPAVRARIFEPFFTTKPAGQGTGMGLSICQGIVSGLGGELTVESEPGQGTTFRVTLPPAPPDAAPTPEAPPTVRFARRGRVLVVDDEPLVGTAVARVLRRHHDVVAVSRAEDAWQRLLRGEMFDVIFCDLMMPDLSGPEFHRRVAERFPELARHLVFVTGGAFTTESRQFLESVPNLVLEKPLEEARLLSALSDHIR